MGEQALAKSRHRFLVVSLFYFLLFAYPLLSLLWRRSYPFFSVEVAILFLILAVFGILLAVIFENIRPAIANVLSPLLITIAFMLQFNLLLQGLLACFSVSLLVAWWSGSNFQRYGLPILLMLMVGAYFDSFEDSGELHSAGGTTSVNSELPPVVHILFDSFIGIDGLPPYPASEILAELSYTFFEDYDFHLFPRAYSRYAATGDSLYAALNFKNDGDSKFVIEVALRRQHVVSENAVFGTMEELGYGLSVYQTGYLDFCQSNPVPMERCWQYPQPNMGSIRSVGEIKLKLRMMLKVLVSQSTLASDLVVSNRWLLDQGVAYHDPRVFESLENDLLSESSGKYYFAHVLLPHGPFAFMNDCSIDYESPLWARYAALDGEPVQDDEIYEIRTMRYFEQVECAMTSMGQIFESMKAAGIYEKSIIVVHGDHGSRIGKFRPEYKNLALLTPAEYRANFSTLFAVKFPGGEGKVDNRVLPLSTLLEEFSATVEAEVTGQGEAVFMKTLPDSADKVDLFVFLSGTYPMHRVDINIFED